ncbi:MAG: HAD-IIIA family hydrolase [Candidatus Scalindua sp. AMX11]|nr:MAG: HAD-IIIA family hydrolase [Candidatus Scalindua sp.]NOG83847.1 HAD-IIIA family hydrolase [Planctomycetota bacterium]RZV83028.1 MAG: HAD-IIIA family hydrolase [Candidatus Scalindua sp. SCAELEC01]TDE64502.1 MAG: HAD-IIIA family hydrolase [Candidatus Scalindua sp. AMX11]
MVIFDVDGVFSDGKIVVNSDGIESKNFYVQDGTGITYLQRAGIKTAIISGRKSKVVEYRAKELSIDDVFLGVQRKIEAYETLLEKYKLDDHETCYIGDDLIDLPVLRRVGFSVAVPNARQEVKECASYVTVADGGHGAIREVVEKILKSQGKWESIIEKYY